MSIILTFFHIIVCMLLIGVVLLQTGKRADLAGAFGGGGSQTAFGARGAATLLSRITTWAAVIFMVTSFGLSVLATRHAGRSGSVLEDQPAPVAPAPPSAPSPGTDPGAAVPDPSKPPANQEPSAPAPATPPAESK